MILQTLPRLALEGVGGKTNFHYKNPLQDSSDRKNNVSIGDEIKKHEIKITLYHTIEILLFSTFCLLMIPRKLIFFKFVLSQKLFSKLSNFMHCLESLVKTLMEAQLVSLRCFLCDFMRVRRAV